MICLKPYFHIAFSINLSFSPTLKPRFPTRPPGWREDWVLYSVTLPCDCRCRWRWPKWRRADFQFVNKRWRWGGRMLVILSVNSHLDVGCWIRPNLTTSELKSQKMSLLYEKTNQWTGDVPSHNQKVYHELCLVWWCHSMKCSLQGCVESNASYHHGVPWSVS